MMYVHDWRAWQPGRRDTAHSRLSVEEKPAGAQVPAMLRRRLTSIGRALCDMLAELDAEADYPLLYASRHGDGERTLAMLEALADEAPPVADPLRPVGAQRHPRRLLDRAR